MEDNVKKILIVASEFSPGMIPFATTIISSLSKDSRHKIHAIVVNSGKYSYHFDSIDNISSIRYPKSIFLKFLYKFWPIPIIKAIELENTLFKPDIIHFLTGDFTLGLYALFSNSLRFKLCYTVHDLSPHELSLKDIRSNLLQCLISINERILRSRARILTTSSLAQMKILNYTYNGKKKIAFTKFPSLVTDKIKFGCKIPEELNGIEHYILFFGNVVAYKGVEYLVKAFGELHLSNEWYLVIAGRGEISMDISHYKRIIHINRFIDDEEINNLFKKSDLVVYPYISATMSGVLSIAYYNECKVVMSDVEFFKENCVPGSYLFKAGSVEDLKRQILLALKNKEKVNIRSYNLLYSNENLIDGYSTLYSL